MKGFKAFLLRGNIVDLAVAVVIGIAFNAVVQALVKDVITPLVAAVGGQPNFGNLVIKVGSASITYGLFLNAVISFLILAAVVYFLVVSPMTRALNYAQRNKAATQKQCPECLSQIPLKATRCMYCTATLPPAQEAAPAAAGAQ
jgi:large conductance mechanosensitive channel